MTTTQTSTLRTYTKCLLDQGADIAQYANGLAARLGVTAADVLAMAATLGPARVVHAADLAAERCREDAMMTRSQRAACDHEED